jgi:microcystin-dependent protein
MTGSTDDTAVFTVGTNGTLTIETTDTAAAAGNIQITADGTAELAGTTVTLDSSGDIVLDADGADVIFKDGGTTILSFTNSSSDAVITSGVQDKDIIFKGDDGGSAITALTLDMSAAGAATFNGAITGGGLLTTGGNIVIPDAGTIGSASDTDAIAISSGGVVTMNQIPVFSAGINVSGGSIAGTLSTAAQTNITSVGTLSSLATSGDITVGDDIFLDSDSSVIHFGDDGDVTLTHVADTGLLLNSTMQLQFNDSSQFINAPSATVLDINATDEIELNATTIDVNGNLDVSGTIIDGDGGGTVPPGTVLPYTGSSAPTGFVLCDDSAISRTTFSVLFAIIGTSYGTGNGSTTFNVPDLRDRLPLGKGTNNSSLGAITAAAGASAVVATASGSASLTKSTGTFATSAKDSSTSSALTNVTSGGHTHNLTLPAQVFNYIIKT